MTRRVTVTGVSAQSRLVKSYTGRVVAATWAGGAVRAQPDSVQKKTEASSPNRKNLRFMVFHPFHSWFSPSSIAYLSRLGYCRKMQVNNTFSLAVQEGLCYNRSECADNGTAEVPREITEEIWM